MFQAVTWEGRAKKLPQKPPTVLTRGAEFGIVQRPGTARFHRTAHRLNDAFQTLRAQVPVTFRAAKGEVAPDLNAIFEEMLLEVKNAAPIQEMPLKLTGRKETTVKIFEEIWINDQKSKCVGEYSVLISLDINWLQIGAHGVERLVDAVLESNCNKSLTALMLGCNFIRDEACKHLKRLLEKNCTIKSLVLDNNGIEQQGATLLGDALRANRTLKTVDLSRNTLGYDGLKAILDGMQSMAGCLRALNLSDNGFQPEAFALLSQGLARNLVPLLSLTLCEGRRMVSTVQGNQLAALIGASLSRNTTLTSLNLPDNLIGDAGFGDLADSLPVNTALVHLNVRGNRITEWGCGKVGSAIAVNSTLQSLDLSANDISAGGETASLIQNLRANTTITTLDLSSNVCHFATEAPVEECMLKNRSIAVERNSDMNACVVRMAGAIQTREHSLAKARQQALSAMEKQRHSAALLQPLIHGTKQKVLVVSETWTSAEAAHTPPNIFSDITPSESEKEENKWSCVNARVLALYPGNPRRVYLHRNDPQRCGKGHQLTLPAGARPEALWTLLFNTANRVLNLNGWPGRCVFLDSTYFKWMSEEGLSEVLGRGALITARHLPFMTDGIELVVSDGKGDGLGCINKYYARGCVGQRRNKHRVLYLQNQDHWSVQYWRIFVRYYRFKQVLLSNLKRGKFDNAMLSRFREFDAAAVASSVLEANHEEANLTHADLEHWSIA